jgi:hypothetical protein
VVPAHVAAQVRIIHTHTHTHTHTLSEQRGHSPEWVFCIWILFLVVNVVLGKF